MRTKEGQPVRLADYRPTDYAIDRVELTFDLAPQTTRVRSHLHVSRREGTPAGTSLVLDGDELTFVSAALDGTPLPPDTFEAAPDRFALALPPAEPFVLTLVTELAPEANTKLMGLYRSNGTWCTQCEAEGFRRITWFLDRPDVLSVYTVRIEADRSEAPVLLANGNLVEAGEVAGREGRHYAVWHDPFPKPSYLFATVAGNLADVRDSFTTFSGRSVELRIYVEPGKTERAAYAMDSLKRAMRWDEVRFGREYDLDVFMVVAVSDFNMGAMENKGLNVFNDKYILADPAIATDEDYAGIEAVIAHEYFHNWTGNRITCRDWFQLCLKEGLTVYRDQEFTSDERSRAVKRISDVRLLRTHQFPEDAGPLAHPVRPDTYHEISNFYTATVYEKGAEVVRMLATLLGEDGFRAGMDLYFERHDGQAVTVEDFVACFADATGRSLDDFMRWYSQAGTPVVTVAEHWDAAAGRYTLTLSQETPATPGQEETAPVVIPLRFGLIGRDGNEIAAGPPAGIATAGDVMILDTASATATFEGLAERPVPSLLRGFSAPVNLSAPWSEDDLLFLMRHDSDPFSRWQAAQGVATDWLVRHVRRGGANEPPAGFVAAMGEIATDTTLDPAFRALALQIPSEREIARVLARDIDPDRVRNAYVALKTALGADLEDVLARLHDENAVAGPYSPSAADAGRRSLRNTALDLLVSGGSAEAAELVWRRFEDAGNMTDRLAALASLVLNGAPRAEEALARFEEMFADEPLALDKWFALQAQTPRPETLERVEALTRHPRFSFSNPNRIRALIGAFATGNSSQFNRADGAGYRFVADVIADLDRTNPQVAARLLTAFRSWRSFEETRRQAAEAALERIARVPDLSPDSSDILTRMRA